MAGDGERPPSSAVGAAVHRRSAATFSWRRDVELGPEHRVVRQLGIEAQVVGRRVVLRRRPLYRRLVSTAVWLVGVAVAVFIWPLSLGGRSSFVIVAGTSMEPTLHSGDLVLIRRQDAYSPGDVLAYAVPEGEPGAGAHVIHRLREITDDGVFVMRGDNRQANDGWHPTRTDVLGRRVLLIPRAGSLLMQARRPWLIGLIVGSVVCAFSWPRRRKPALRAQLPREPCCLGPDSRARDAARAAGR